MSETQRTLPLLVPPGQGLCEVPGWVEDPEQSWLSCQLLAQSGPLLTARLDRDQQCKQYDLRVAQVEPANPPSNALLPPPDLTSLHHINEPCILQALQDRSLKDEAYTFVGSILVAVNPLKRIEDPPGALGTAKASERPHPFAVAEAAYSQMSFVADARRTNKSLGEMTNQSIVASGESGAGKTESAKMVLRHLVARTSGGSSTIDKRLLGSNPITEAFGNASTLRNENSSRFGKLLRLHFEQDLVGDTRGPARWGIRGASVRTYLLERSRVTLHEAGERNFHVFYQLLNGVDAGKRGDLGLNCTKEWRYLRALSGPEASASALLPGAKPDESRVDSDKKDYQELITSFAALGFIQSEIDSIFRIVAGVLHLGNIQFENDETTAEGEIACPLPESKQHIDYASKLFALSPASLSKVLTERELNARGEKVIVKRNAAAASFARDAIAKGVYSSLFDFLIRRIDKALDDSAGNQNVSALPFVGVLDIFGFESFVRNGFEQLLINFANEALQLTFNKSVFVSELDLYKSEGLMLEQELKAPPDNSQCMQLLMGGGSVKLGLLPMINSQAQVPQANDANMTSALHREFHAHADFPKPHPKDRATQFMIRHYAGAVAYTVQGFVEKNNDKLPDEIGFLFNAAGDVFVASELFKDHDTADKKVARSVVAKFTGNIKDLIESLESTKVSFIRCVKPNAEMKRQGTTWFNRKYVSVQLRSLSVPQAANVLRSGLPTRIPYSVIAAAYKTHLSEDALAIWKRRGKGSEKAFTAALFWAFEINADSYRLGFTKVFFKSGKLAELERVMQAAGSWTPAERDGVGKRFKLYYIRTLWRQAYTYVRAEIEFSKLYRRARARVMAAHKIVAFLRMVPHRKRFLQQYKNKRKDQEKAKADEERLKREAERAEKRRLEDEQREKEMVAQIEKERIAMQAALAQQKKENAMEREQLEKLRVEREEAMQRATTAEQKREEAEKLHRQALAARILAEAAAAEQNAFDEELRKGRELTKQERSKALEKYETQFAAEMARYEARRKYYGNLQNVARRELQAYNQKIVDFLQSDQIQDYVKKAKAVMDFAKVWLTVRLERLQSPEGRQMDKDIAIKTARATAEQARIVALRARALLHEQLKEFAWYQKALDQRVQLRAMAKSLTGERRFKFTESSVQLNSAEWNKPVVSGANQSERLRALLDAGKITPDEYAQLVGALLESVERQSSIPVVAESAAMGVQMICPKCGKFANTSKKTCDSCKAVLLTNNSDDDLMKFEESDGWTVPVKGHKGQDFHVRISGTETVLDPMTFTETRLFVVEACIGNGGADSVFWRVAHPFTDFVHIHRELMDSKSSVVTKEAKEVFPSFPQADAAAETKHRRSSLMSFFGAHRKPVVKKPEPGAGIMLSSNPSAVTNVLKMGEAFLKQWLKDVFKAVAQHPAKPEKAGEDPFIKFKPIDVFFHIHENAV